MNKSSLLFPKLVTILETPYKQLPHPTQWMLKLILKCIFNSVKSVVLVAWLLLPYLLIKPRWSYFDSLLILWCLSEITFFFYCQFYLPQKLRRRPRQMTFSQQLENLKRFCYHSEGDQEVFNKWFLQPPQDDDIHFGYNLEWIYWFFFDRKPEELNKNELKQAQFLIKQLEPRYKSSSNCQPLKPYTLMRPSIDPVKVQTKPLSLYLYLMSFKLIVVFILNNLGFKNYEANPHNITYWIYEPTVTSGNSEPPIMFVHGIGIGIASYIMKVYRMRKDFPHRRIILLELNYISLSFFSYVPDRDETLAALDTIVANHALPKFSLVAHSYGTLIAGWFVQNRPQYLSHLSMIDPICFKIWDSQLAHNFLYAQPNTFLHELMQFFIYQDPLISYTVSKEIYWHEANCWPENLVVPTKIYFSRQDWIINATNIHDYLHKFLLRNPNPQVDLQLFDTTHGGYLFKPKLTKEILSHL